MGLEVALWRAVAVYRFAALAYAAILMVSNYETYTRPWLGWTVLGVMAAWTIIAAFAYSDPSRRGWPLLVTDFLVTVSCLLASQWVVPKDLLERGSATLPMAWVAAVVMAWAISGGRRRGVIAALGIGAGDLWLRGSFATVAVNATVLLVFVGFVVGYLVRRALDVERQLQQATELEAATRERERLARGIHDSVLQVLALIARRGKELGGEAGELGRLAAEQEVTLRSLVTSRPTQAAGASAATASHSGTRVRGKSAPGGAASRGDAGKPGGTGTSGAGTSGAGGPKWPGLSRILRPSRPRGGNGSADSGPAVDLRERLSRFASPQVEIAAPATAVLLPAHVADELAAAVGSALDNVKLHCGPMARAWVLVEDEGTSVAVTIRDNGPGIAAGRLDQAAAEGRLGVAQSILGRIRDLGGSAGVTSADGTEVELRVPR